MRSTVETATDAIAPHPLSARRHAGRADFTAARSAPAGIAHSRLIFNSPTSPTQTACPSIIRCQSCADFWYFCPLDAILEN